MDLFIKSWLWFPAQRVSNDVMIYVYVYYCPLTKDIPKYVALSGDTK